MVGVTTARAMAFRALEASITVRLFNFPLLNVVSPKAV